MALQGSAFQGSAFQQGAGNPLFPPPVGFTDKPQHYGVRAGAVALLTSFLVQPFIPPPDAHGEQTFFDRTHSRGYWPAAGIPFENLRPLNPMPSNTIGTPSAKPSNATHVREVHYQGTAGPLTAQAAAATPPAWGFEAVLSDLRLRKAVAQQFDQWTPFGAAVVVTPQGYEAVFPALYRKPVSAAQQQFLPDQRTFPDLPPNGWPAIAPELIKRPVRASQQMVTGDVWLGNVPTPFVANAWVIAWDGPQRKRVSSGVMQFDLPVLAAYNANVITYPEGWRAEFPAAKARAINAAGQQFTPDQRFFPDLAPWGWPAVAPELTRKRVPAAQQMLTGDIWIGNVPTAATPQGWVSTFPERFTRPVKAGLQQFDLPVLAAYTTVIVTYPDGWQSIFPAPRKAPHKPQQFDTFTPFGSGPVYTVIADGGDSAGTFRKRLPAAQQLVTGDIWVGNVPTQFINNAWVAMWDGPQRKRVPVSAQQFDLPVLGAYSTVIIVYPDGWQTVFDLRPTARRQVAGNEVVITTVASAPQGWQTSDGQMPAKRRSGVHIWPDSPAFAFTAPYSGFLDLGDTRGRKPRKAAGEAILAPKTPDPVAGLTNAALWGDIGARFRTSHLRPQPPDFARLFRVTPRIASQPPLLGQSTGPTLYGRSTAPTLLGVSTNPTLLGVSTNPTLLGRSTDPTLLGTV